jgi:hypothetical protein
MPRKKPIIKKTSKNSEWQGRLDERTAYLKEAVIEMKEHNIKFDEKVERKFSELDASIDKKLEGHREKVDKKFESLNECIDQKFKNHNDYHTNKERKYLKIFIGLTALTVGGLLANPSGVEQIAVKVVSIIKFLIRIF